jgi:major membrane immunogen (membrane-anchored lipoprotein)
MKRTLGVLALLILLSACGESPQAMTVTTKDGSPYAGTGKAFTDPGWKQGDKAS